MDSTNHTGSRAGGDLLKMFEGPSAEGLSDAQRGLVLNAEKAFTDLDKLVTNIRMYGSKHQSVERFRARLFESVEVILSEQETLAFEVRPYEICVLDQVIYENSNPENNFIYRMYLDGIRDLVLKRGLEIHEVDALVDVFLTDWDDPAFFEDDCVTLMWDANFANIEYGIVENFAEDVQQDDDSLYTIRGVLDRVRSANQNRPTNISSARAQVLKLDHLGIDKKDLASFQEVLFTMDEREFDVLKDTIQTTSREKLEKFIEILFKVSTIETFDDARRNRVIKLFDRIGEFMLRKTSVGDFERFLRIIRRMGSNSEKTDLDEKISAEYIIDHWSKRDFVERISAPIMHGPYDFGASVVAIFGLLNPHVMGAVTQVASDSTNIDFQERILELVTERFDGIERSVADVLRTAEPAFAHHLLSIFIKHGKREATTYAIRVSMKNANPEVRFEALSRIGEDEFELFSGLLLTALEDSSKSVRSKAIHLLARLPRPDVHRRIVACISNKAFQQYELDEKRRYYAAASLTGNANELWIKQFTATTLLGRALPGQEDARHCAAVAMAIRLNTDAKPLFEKELERRIKAPVVVEGVKWSLQHLDADRTERTRQLYDLFFHGRLTGIPEEDSIGEGKTKKLMSSGFWTRYKPNQTPCRTMRIASS